MTTLVTPEVGIARRSGIGHFLHSYRAMIRFEVTNLREFLIFALAIQTFMGAGMGLMYGFYLGDLPAQALTFLVSGIPALALFPIGFVMVPSAIGDLKWEETYDFVWSLPVPRLASALASFTVFTALAIPGTIASLLISVLVYDVQLQPSPMIVPAILMSAAMATSVGYAMGHGIKRAEIINLLTNLLIFVVLMFSPIVVPIEMFPTWLAAIHRVLPFWHMANLVRSGLTDGLVADVGWSYAVAGLWTLGAAWVAARIITRRG